MIKSIKLKFTEQPHYRSGGLDTMECIDKKFTDETYLGLVLGDVRRGCRQWADRRVVVRLPQESV